MNDHPYGWLSLLPPVIAIVLSIITRRVVLSLFLGVFTGALIVSGWNPLVAIPELVVHHLFAKLIESNTLHIFAFTILMGMMVGVVNRSAGMRGLVNAVTPFANNRPRGQFTTWLLGLIVFFDDYANTLLLGSTLKSLTDKLKISREKLAYIVDSTAAPVAGLALISTWVAGEIGYVQQGLDRIPEAAEVEPYTVFVASIPYRFYILWALLFVPMVALLSRDFGPMLKAEQAAQLDSDKNADFADSQTDKLADPTGPDSKTPARWFNAVIPVAVTVIAVIWFLFQTGGGLTFKKSLMETFGAADSYASLLWGALAGLVSAIVLIVPQRIVPINRVVSGAWHGALLMLPALVILWLAQVLSTMTKGDPPPEQVDATPVSQSDENDFVAEPSAEEVDAPNKFPNRSSRLYTTEFLTPQLDRISKSDGFFGQNFTQLLPTIVFLLAAIVAFSTGTSWGTMGIVMPLVIPLAWAQLATVELVAPDHPILLCCIGSVLAGAIFGDHCSPISDTTVLSSQATGCDHAAHVRTQLPYALLVAAVSVCCGTLPLGYGVSVWLLLPAGVIVMLVFLLVFGKRCTQS